MHAGINSRIAAPDLRREGSGTYAAPDRVVIGSFENNKLMGHSKLMGSCAAPVESAPFLAGKKRICGARTLSSHPAKHLSE
jgi:hypothetical protein